MEYGKRPDGMSDEDWLIECQCRHVAREMKAGQTRFERVAIYERWHKILPSITKQRVGELWTEIKRQG